MIDRDRHTYAETVVCPWCGQAHSDAWEWEEGEHECHECGRTFDLERIVDISYTTRPMVKCVLCGAMVKQRRDGTVEVHYFEFERCAGSPPR